MLSFLERKGQQVFERYGFSAEGESQAGCPAVTQAKDYQPQVLETGRVASALEAVCQDMRQRGLAEFWWRSDKRQRRCMKARRTRSLFTSTRWMLRSRRPSAASP